MKTKLTIAAFVLMIATVANGAITCYQEGIDGALYVYGDNTDDAVYISMTNDSALTDLVYVYDFQTGEEGYFYVYYENGVYVDTGNGEDYVCLYDGISYLGVDVCIETGNGDDYVSIYDDYSDNEINVCTGNGDDYVSAWTYFAGNIYIETGNGDDGVYLDGYWEDISGTPYYGYYGYVDVDFGRGDDCISGEVDWAWGALDGGQGYDCNYLYINNAFTGDVTNFEY